MFNQVLVVVLLAMTAYGLVQGIRLKKLSEFARALAGALLLAMLLRKGGQWLTLAGLASLVLQRYLAIRERRGAVPLPEASSIASTVSEASREPAPRHGDSPSDDPATARTGFQHLEIPHGAATLACEGGELVLEAGVLEVQLQISRTNRETQSPEVDHFHAELRFADADGSQWQVDSYFAAELFCDDFENEERRAIIESGSGFKTWRRAEPAWKAALRERCLLAEASGLLDSREYFDITISGEVHTLFMKHQGPRVDVSTFGSSLLLRMSGIYVWRKIEEKQDYVPLDPFAWLTRSDLLLCFASPRHYPTSKELDECLEAHERSPFIAKRLPTPGQLQTHVRFRARSEG